MKAKVLIEGIEFTYIEHEDSVQLGCNELNICAVGDTLIEADKNLRIIAKELLNEYVKMSKYMNNKDLERQDKLKRLAGL